MANIATTQKIRTFQHRIGLLLWKPRQQEKCWENSWIVDRETEGKSRHFFSFHRQQWTEIACVTKNFGFPSEKREDFDFDFSYRCCELCLMDVAFNANESITITSRSFRHFLLWQFESLMEGNYWSFREEVDFSKFEIDGNDFEIASETRCVWTEFLESSNDF